MFHKQGSTGHQRMCSHNSNWRKEVEKIINGPLASRSDKVKINHVYIWAGA